MSALIDSIAERFADALIDSHSYRGDDTVTVRRESLLEVARFVKEDPAFRMNLLVDLSAVDYSAFGESPKSAFFSSSGVAVRPTSGIEDEAPWPGPPAGARFTGVYHFFSTTHKHRLRIVVPVEESDPRVDTVSTLWPGANWLEREVWDMFGVKFSGHPDLRRILMPDGWQGHPQRKDYPLEGPGELLLESPMEWLRLRNLQDEAEIE